ncbi:hypothetical protein ANN_13052 [Periplaneta americana]|uniref:HAT C-terminal dimerisation domain-containing protein n=1 Tax=Periplaneta americana TaxID=6978 RepID=A0ABQ8TKB7_PERAM|nr:hypothetical protein ANN_13052 [Periplaneta americana]
MAREKGDISARKYKNLTKEQLYDSYKILYYEIIDNILMQMNIRFQDINKLKFVALIDTSKFEVYSKKFPNSELNSLHEHYPALFPRMSRLKAELELLYSDSQYKNVPIQNVVKLLQENEVHKDVFSETYKLLSLIMTVPSTSVSAERSFSSLNRIKNYLRSSMSLANISMQKEIVKKIMKNQPFHNDVTDKFSAMKDRRIQLVFKK